MKKNLLLVILFLLLVLSSCHNTVESYQCQNCNIIISNNIEFCPNCGKEIEGYDIIDTDDNGSVKEFLEMVNGIWIDTTTCKSYGNGDASFSFCGFSDGGIFFGTYPGSYSRIGKITDVEASSDGKYFITLFYQAEEYFGDYYDESYEEHTLCFESDMFYFVDYADIVYTYMGKDLESAIQSAIEFVSKKQQRDIPKLGLSASYLGIDKSTLKSKQKLYGPEHQFYFHDNAVYWLFLKNIESSAVYQNTSSGTYFGLIDNQVVFQGYVNTNMQIRDVILNAENPSIEGKRYELSRDGGATSFQAYLWEIDNGYLLITFYENPSLEFYQQRTHSVTIVSDLKYLNLSAE